MEDKRFKIQGRVKHCVIENLEVIARDGEAPECYVGGDAEFILNAMNSVPVAEKLHEAATLVQERIEAMYNSNLYTTGLNYYNFDKVKSALRTALAEYESSKEIK